MKDSVSQWAETLQEGEYRILVNETKVDLDNDIVSCFLFKYKNYNYSDIFLCHI
jgi:hypothetical protein